MGYWIGIIWCIIINDYVRARECSKGKRMTNSQARGDIATRTVQPARWSPRKYLGGLVSRYPASNPQGHASYRAPSVLLFISHLRYRSRKRNDTQCNIAETSAQSRE